MDALSRIGAARGPSILGDAIESGLVGITIFAADASFDGVRAANAETALLTLW